MNREPPSPKGDPNTLEGDSRTLEEDANASNAHILEAQRRECGEPTLRQNVDTLQDKIQINCTGGELYASEEERRTSHSAAPDSETQNLEGKEPHRMDEHANVLDYSRQTSERTNSQRLEVMESHRMDENSHGLDYSRLECLLRKVIIEELFFLKDLRQHIREGLDTIKAPPEAVVQPPSKQKRPLEKLLDEKCPDGFATGHTRKNRSKYNSWTNGDRAELAALANKDCSTSASKDCPAKEPNQVVAPRTVSPPRTLELSPPKTIPQPGSTKTQSRRQSGIETNLLPGKRRTSTTSILSSVSSSCSSLLIPQIHQKRFGTNSKMQMRVLPESGGDASAEEDAPSRENSGRPQDPLYAEKGSPGSSRRHSCLQGKLDVYKLDNILNQAMLLVKVDEAEQEKALEQQEVDTVSSASFGSSVNVNIMGATNTDDGSILNPILSSDEPDPLVPKRRPNITGTMNSDNGLVMSPILSCEEPDPSVGKRRPSLSQKSDETHLWTTVDALRGQQDRALVDVAKRQSMSGDKYVSEDSDDVTSKRLRILFRMQILIMQLCGVVPLRHESNRRWCGWVVPAFTAASLAYYMQFALSVDQFTCLALSGMCYPIASLLGFALIRLGDPSAGGLLVRNEGLLSRYASAHEFETEWLRNSSKSCVYIWCLWFVASVIWVFAASSAYTTSLPLASFLGPIAGGWLVAALMCCHLHICFHLELVVDKFCIGFFQSGDFTEAVHEWALLQAILRQAATAISPCLLVVQTCILLALLLIGVQMTLNDGDLERDWSICASVVPYVLIALKCLMQAAAVTEKCSRVPPLMNSVGVDESPLDAERQYLVEYIEHSGAGFYVNGVRVTAFMVLKLSYVSVMLVFGFAARVFQN